MANGLGGEAQMLGGLGGGEEGGRAWRAGLMYNAAGGKVGRGLVSFSPAREGMCVCDSLQRLPTQRPSQGEREGQRVWADELWNESPLREA